MPTWTDVKANIGFVGAGYAGGGLTPLPSNTDVLNLLEYLYNNSTSVEALLNRIVGGPTFIVGECAANLIAFGGQAIIGGNSHPLLGLNFAAMAGSHFFNEQGELVGDVNYLIIAHELVHAIDGAFDPYQSVATDAQLNGDLGSDMDGPAVTLQDAVAFELALTNKYQAGYYSGLHTSDWQMAHLSLGVSYSEGNKVDNVRFSLHANNTLLDTSQQGKAEVVIGFNQNETIAAGAGNDWLYGGTGDDILIGGSGNDLLFGGDFISAAASAADGTDTANYSMLTTTAVATSGITLNADFTSTITYAGLRVLQVQNDGTGGTDRLVSIERIIATDFADKFQFNGQFDNGLDLKIDARGTSAAPADHIDLAAATNGFAVLGGAAANSATVRAQGGGGSVVIENFFGDITGSAQDDLIISGAGNINGGDGADYILGGGAHQTLLGGGGSDRILVGDSRADGGAGNDWFENTSSTGTGSIVLAAGGGHDVIDVTTGAVIDIGSAGFGALSIAWEKVLVSQETWYIDAEWDTYTARNFEGRIALTLDGASIAIGTAEGRETRREFTGAVTWSDVHYDAGVTIRSNGVDISFGQLLVQLGLEQASGQFLPPNGPIASSSWFDAEQEWAGAYTGQGTGMGSGGASASAGDDTFIGNDLSRTISYATSLLGVNIDLGLGNGVQNTGGSGNDYFHGILNLIGSAFDDVLAAQTGGSDLYGEGGDDALVGKGATDLLWGGDGNDHLAGGDGSDELDGGDGNDVLDGGEGDDVLIGSEGVDVLNGGGGIDTVDYSNAGAGMRAQLNTNASSNDGDGGTDTFSGVENLTGSAFNDILIGDAGGNVLRGGLGSDTLLGLAGDDVLWGGEVATNQLQGGLGDDLYVLEANDTVVELVGEGIDTVEAHIAVHTLANNVENLVFGGTGNFTGSGNAMNNTITGGAGDDVLRGRGGTDVLQGGLGIDTADYSFAASAIHARLDTMSAVNDGDGSTDTFVGIEAIVGSAFNDLLVGGALGDRLSGGFGADTLLGGAGDDILAGGQGAANQLQGGVGDDLYVLDAYDTVVELAGQGIDTIEAHVGAHNMGANVENMYYVGFNKFYGTGNAIDNVITGGIGDDILKGLGGNDTLIGGGGLDEVQFRGAKADYTVSAEGAGYRVIDSVAGRDGSTFVDSVEVLRFMTGNTTTALAYPPPGAAPPETTSKEANPEVLPSVIDDKTWDDAFVLPAVPDDQPMILPEPERQKFEDAPLVLPGPEQSMPSYFGLAAHLPLSGDWMLTLDPNSGLTTPLTGRDDWAGC